VRTGKTIVQAKNFPIEAKIRVACEVLIGREIRSVAERHRISRQAVYLWTKKAREALFEVLKPGKNGCKPKVSEVNLVIKRQEKTINRLNQLLLKAEDEIARLTKALKDREPAKPQKCPECGCEKIYKNGTYKRKSKALPFDCPGNKNDGLVTVQKFVCAYCGHSFCAEIKKYKF